MNTVDNQTSTPTTGTTGMTKIELVDLLIEDVLNEYKHMLFYLNASCFIQGLARVELGEWLAEEARDEMKHVEEFTKLIIELGGSEKLQESFSRINLSTDIKELQDPEKILTYVLDMEEEVVKRYTQRMDDAVNVSKSDPVAGRWVEIFLEEQILDSKGTAAHVRQIKCE